MSVVADITLVAFELRLELGEVRVEVLTPRHAGKQLVILGRDALTALKRELAPLLDHLKRRANGPVFAVSVNFERQSLTAAGGTGAVRMGGQELADLAAILKPLVDALGGRAAVKLAPN